MLGQRGVRWAGPRDLTLWKDRANDTLERQSFGSSLKEGFSIGWFVYTGVPSCWFKSVLARVCPVMCCSVASCSNVALHPQLGKGVAMHGHSRALQFVVMRGHSRALQQQQLLLLLPYYYDDDG